MGTEACIGCVNLVVLKDYISFMFKKELKKNNYLNNEEIKKILCDALEYFEMGSNHTGEYELRPLWWTFVTPNYSAYIIHNGKEDPSGIYQFDRKAVEKEFKKYKSQIIKRLSKTGPSPA